MKFSELFAMANYSDVHKRMLRYVFLQTELLLNDNIIELSEYDIQAMIYMFFRTRLKEYELSEAQREREGRTDIIVNQVEGHRIYLELKTYFKENETFRKEDFDHDFKKLLDKALTENSKAYFIIAGLKKKFNEKEINKYDFLVGKYLNMRDKTSYTLEINDERVTVEIRPSAGQREGRCHIWSWEIMGIKKEKKYPPNNL